MHPAAQSRILDKNSTPSIHCFEAAPAVEMAKNSHIGGSENDNSTTKTTNFTGSNFNIASYLVGMHSDPTNELMTPTEADFFPFENSSHCACAQDVDDTSNPLPPLRELLEIQSNSKTSPLTLPSNFSKGRNDSEESKEDGNENDNGLVSVCHVSFDMTKTAEWH